MKTKAEKKPFTKKSLQGKEESLGKETEIGYPITQEDVINSDWVQEIKDKVITPCGDSISYGLVGMWDLCGNISKFTDERLEKQKNEFLELIDGIDIDLMFTDIKDNKGNINPLSEEIMKIIRLWWEKKSKELKSAVEGRK